MNVSENFSWRKVGNGSPYFFIIIIYSVAHLGLLINFNGIWWDDWTLYGTSATALQKEYKELGSFPPGLANLLFFLNELGPVSYRLITFTCYLFSTLILYKIIHRDFSTYNFALPIAILFAVLPVNAARIAAINIAYAICLFLFLWAAYTVRKNLIIGATLLFASYMTASLLTFTLLIILNEIRFLIIKNKSIMKNTSILRISLLVTVPLIYWIIKNIWFKPTGKYENYNQDFSLANFPYQIKATSLGVVSINLSLVTLLISIVLLSLILVNFNLPNSVNLKVLLTGFAIIFLGCLPYWVVGLIPSSKDWNSRHQLLMPFGLSLVLAYILLRVPRMRKAMFVFFVSLSISWWTNTYNNFASETKYLESVVSELISIRAEVRKCDELFVEEFRIDRNSERPVKRFYEWNGMLTSAGFEEQVTVIPNSDIKGFDSGKYDLYFNSIYKASNFVRSSENIRCRLEVTEFPDESSVKIQVSSVFQP
jgi:hypothetical protein